VNSVDENATLAGKLQGGARECEMAKRIDIIAFRSTKSNLCFTSPLAWRRACGLMTLSDLACDYESVREPRGPYFVSLPEDLR
jgi:hypothetical protein